ncbi:MAG: 30S ribosomal protein S6 [Planctomycetota bacterium]|nr:MAG: 30S ribosomal protein S6 [Planctomycetota bacterium]
MQLYEGMFLLNAAEASRDWDGVEGRIADLLTRHGGEVVRAEKWAERRLAYDIAGQSKGVYYLVFFKAPPESVQAIRGDCRLQRDLIIREIFLKQDESALQKATYSDSEIRAAERARRMTRDTGSPEKDVKKPEPAKAEAEKPAAPSGDAKPEEKASAPAEDTQKT